MNKITKTGTGADSAEAVRRVYEREAGNYDRNVKLPERLLFSGGREWVCAQAEGEVLEIAVGTGRNLPHYPDGVRLTGIDFVPAMLDVARRRAVELGRPVELRLGDAQALEFEDATFDTVVCTLSLCTIPDDRAAVAEVRRVLRPGGRSSTYAVRSDRSGASSGCSRRRSFASGPTMCCASRSSTCRPRASRSRCSSAPSSGSSSGC
jgi:ubiquinone/menaquinone biosynthesis C-methylase UbiE